MHVCRSHFAVQTFAFVCKLPPDASIRETLTGLKVQAAARPRHITAVRKLRSEWAVEQQTVDFQPEEPRLGKTTVCNKRSQTAGIRLFGIPWLVSSAGGFLPGFGLSWRLLCLGPPPPPFCCIHVTGSCPDDFLESRRCFTRQPRPNPDRKSRRVLAGTTRAVVYSRQRQSRLISLEEKVGWKRFPTQT